MTGVNFSDQLALFFANSRSSVRCLRCRRSHCHLRQLAPVHRPDRGAGQGPGAEAHRAVRQRAGHALRPGGAVPPANCLLPPAAPPPRNPGAICAKDGIAARPARPPLLFLRWDFKLSSTLTLHSASRCWRTQSRPESPSTPKSSHCQTRTGARASRLLGNGFTKVGTSPRLGVC